MMSMLEGKNLRRSFGIQRHGGTEDLVLEYCEGRTLSAMAAEGPLSLEKFFPLARNLVVEVVHLHGKNCVHGDLCGDNILVESPGFRVRIIDFGLAFFQSSRRQVMADPDHIEGTLTHLAPEQTGRFAAAIDHRTDLYALGIDLFQLLTGRLPFSGGDGSQFIHQHLALRPATCRSLNPQVPTTLSDCIDRLLEKDPAQRYQSAEGFLIDLDACRTAWESGAELRDFVPHTQEGPVRFEISRKLYGRGWASAVLLRGLEEARQGQFRALLVSGASGIGKSTLVRGLRPSLAPNQGRFVEGKCDQSQSQGPFSVWRQALSALVEPLLSLDESSLGPWRTRLADQLGANGAAIEEIVPNLSLVTGRLERIPDLAGAESWNRLVRTFVRFLSAFASGTHPLVLFLDDVQWMDPGSLKLFLAVLETSDLEGLCLIGACRSNELAANHPILEAFGTRTAEGDRQVLDLDNLTEADVHQLVADSLHRPLAEVEPLAKGIFLRTAGNAFHTHQVLYRLYEEGHLVAQADRAWDWTPGALDSVPMSQNVLDLLTGTLSRLSPSCQTLLVRLACLGNKVRPPLLSLVTEAGDPGSHRDLMEASGSGLIVSDGQGVRFGHDRILAAALGLSSSEERRGIHRDLALRFEGSLDEGARVEFSFELVNQINLGFEGDAELPLEAAQRYARANLEAGRKALRLGAWAQALVYFRTGMGFLGGDGWTLEYPLCLDLHEGAAASSLLAGETTFLETTLTSIHQRARGPLDRTRAWEIQMQHLTAQGLIMPAIRLGLGGLTELGLSLPEEPTGDEVGAFLESALAQIRSRDIETLAHLPEMTDALDLARIRLLAGIGEPAYAAAPPLFLVWASSYVQLALKGHHAVLSPFGFAAFALALCATGRDYELGYQLGSLAAKLAEGPAARASRCRVLNIFGGTIQMWKEDLEATFSVMEEAISSGFAEGDYTSGGYAAFGMSMNLFHRGGPLDQADRRITRNLQHIRRFRQRYHWFWAATYLSAVRQLRGLPPELPPLEEFDPAVWEREATAQGNVGGLGNLSVTSLALAWIFGEETEFLRLIAKVDESIAGVQSTINVPAYHYYSALARLRLAGRDAVPPEVLGSLGFLDQLALLAPVNFQHKADLVRALIAEKEGRFWDALSGMVRAARGAGEASYTQDEAVAWECASRFCEATGQGPLALSCWTLSREAWGRWGAAAKVARMDADRPSWALRLSPATWSAGTGVFNPDFEAALKAGRSIAGEREGADLQGTLTAIMAEAAGAQKAWLILPLGEGWILRTALDENGQIRIGLNTPLGACDELPRSLFRYVERTGKPVVLDDAAAHNPDFDDPAFLRGTHRSVLCLPLASRGKISAILYLENPLLPGAFGEKRRQVLEFLAAQAAVSLENATWYEQVRTLNASLGAEIAERRQSEAMYRLLADNANDIISRHGPVRLDYLYASPAVRQVLGYEEAEMLGRSALEFIHPEDHSELIENLKSLQDGADSVVLCFRKRRKDGVYLWVESNCRAIRRPGSPDLVEVQAATRDISVRKAAEDEVRRMNETLEQKVQERTRELEAAQEGLEVAAKMAVVGRLAANIAHELNTPIAAIHSSASTIIASTLDILDAVLPAFTSFGPEDRALFLELAHRGGIRSQRLPGTSDRDKRMALARRLRDQGVEEAEDLAEEVAFLGAFDLEAPILESLRRTGGQVVFQASQVASTIHSSQIILLAAEGASATVSALSNYARTEDPQRKTSVDPVTDLETVLALYQGRIKRSVVVDREYLSDQAVWGSSDRLKEVWSNLINNALQSMDFHGHLGLRIVREEVWLAVSISDTGPGIPAEVQDKIFTPFFTTKAAGQGRGLGLDICRKIVENHGGTIGFTTQPGHTVFTVRLRPFERDVPMDKIS